MQWLANALIAGSVHGLVAIGFSLIYTTVRFFHFAHAATFTVGAYGAYIVASALGSPISVAVVCGVAAAGLVGGLMELGIYEPLRRAGTSNLGLLLASLGLLIVAQNTIALAFGSETKVLQVPSASRVVELLTARLTLLQVTIVAVGFLLFVGLRFFVGTVPAGRQLRAVADSAELAQVVGVDVRRVYSLVFVIGSSLAGLAGLLIGLDTGFRPEMGFGPLLYGVTAAVVAGVDNVPGAYLGGLFLGVVQQIGVVATSARWQDTITFVVLIIFLAVRRRAVARFAT